VLSRAAVQMQAVAVGWQMYALTGSAYDLGLIGLAQFLPMICLTLAVGQVADRFDRRAVVSICQIVEGLTATALAAGSVGGWLGRDGILGLLIVLGTARAFEGPSTSAMIPSLVPGEWLPRATAWSASAQQTATIVGPSLGGVLYLVAGPAGVYATAAAAFLVGSALVAAIHVTRTPSEREPVNLESAFSGVSFILRHPVILGSISLDLFAVLLGGMTALLPIYARDILGTGPWGLGLLRSAPALGALGMSLIVARRSLGRRVGRTMFRAVIAFGAATIVFAASRWLPLSFVALCVLGAADVVSVVIRLTLVQLTTPDAMRGRVSAVSSLFTGTSNQLGDFRAGVMAGLLGAVPAVMLGGIGTVAVALLWMRWFPELRRVDRLDGRSVA
jgi:MFS family permease